MLNEFSRTELLLGEKAIQKLKNSRVAVFGIGGVGGYTTEALARCGVGHIDLIDNDTVSVTNINRQIIALHSTVGKYKVDVMKNRIFDICEDTVVETYKTFYLPETANEFDFTKYDYIVDAIDTVTGKITLIKEAEKCGTPIISSMGTGNKLDPTRLEVSDIYKTSVCPLARAMRSLLKKEGIKKLKVVYSKEEPLKPQKNTEEQSSKRQIPGSTSFVPPVAGLIIAKEVITDLIKE